MAYVINNNTGIRYTWGGKQLIYDIISPITPPSFLTADGSTKAWYIFDASVTRTDASVSIWADTLGSGRNLLQTTPANQPAWTSDGILFDGVNDNMYADFSFNTKKTIYLLMRMETFETYHYIFEANNFGTGYLRTANAATTVTLDSGTTLVVNSNVDMTAGTWRIITVQFNGADSLFQMDNSTATIGDAGNVYFSNFSIGVSTPANLICKEIILRNTIDSAVNRSNVFNYWNSKYNLGKTAAVNYEAQYQKVYNSFTTKPDASIASAQNTFVKSLVDSGFWDRMDLLYIFANNSSVNALINWKNPGTYNCVELGTGALTFEALGGFRGDGSSYLNTGWNVSTNSVNYTLNSATLGAYLNLTMPEGNNEVILGASDDTNYSHIKIPQGGGIYASIINAGSGGSSVSDTTNSNGMFISTRRAVDDLAGYKNGIAIAGGDAASGAKPDASLFILNRSGSTPLTSKNKISLAFAMNGITTADASILNNMISTYMTAIGPPSFLTTDGSTRMWYIGDVSTDLQFSSYPSVNKWKEHLGYTNYDLGLGEAPTFVPGDSSATGIQFDGTDELWKNPINPMIRQPYTIYAVINHIYFQTGGSYMIWLNSGTGDLRTGDSTSATFAGLSRSVSTNKYGIYRIEATGASYATFQFNEGSVGTVSFDSSIKGFSVGGGQSKMGAKEIIVRGKIDSNSDKQSIYNYLKTKYNIP